MTVGPPVPRKEETEKGVQRRREPEGVQVETERQRGTRAWGYRKGGRPEEVTAGARTR